MIIVIPVIFVFIISFLLIFMMVYNGKKEEIKKKKGKIFAAIGTAFTLGLAPTVVIAAILFALFGSTVFANNMFSLDVSTSNLMFLTVSMVIYLYTIDSFLSVLAEHIMGKNIFNRIVLLLIRTLAFYGLGLIFGLSQTNGFLIAVVVAFIVFFIEYLKSSNTKDVNSR